MGDGVSEEQPEESRQRTYTEIFEEAFPQYLMMGMTPEEYWDGEIGLCKAYREAYRMRMEREDRMADQTAWLQGMYIRNALQSVYLLVNGFVPSGKQAMEYPNKPYSTQEEEKKLEAAETQKQEEQKQKEEEQMKTSMALFQAMATQFNKNFKKRQEEQKAGDHAEKSAE